MLCHASASPEGHLIVPGERLRVIASPRPETVAVCEVEPAQLDRCRAAIAWICSRARRGRSHAHKCSKGPFPAEGGAALIQRGSAVQRIARCTV